MNPDLVLSKKEDAGTETYYVIDTKWKLPVKKIDIADLRQVYAYGHFCKAKKVMLLYPGKPSQSKRNMFLDDSGIEGYVAYVKVVDNTLPFSSLNRNIAIDVMDQFNKL